MNKDLVLQVDLGAITRNYEYLKSCTKANVGAVIKNDAYGLGMLQIASSLSTQNCKDFFVNDVSEGVELRENDINGNIYILHGVFAGEERECVEYNLIPVLNTIAQVLIWSAYATKIQRQLSCAIHIDTGMNRFGLSEDEIYSALEYDGLDILYVISHLACSDVKEHEHNEIQLDQFLKNIGIFKNAKYSLANSDGFFLHEKYHFDLIRPGGALYGINALSSTNSISQAIALFAPIIQIRDVLSNGHVGYGATYEIAKGSKIATIPVGYGDGYPIHLSNNSVVCINGQKAPLIGRVSMNLITIDVSNVACNVGDMVEIIGPNIPLAALATLARVNQYSMQTRLGSHIKRAYV